ncbi:hypothetical protein Vadar_002743 [Vaccinium darrowii]|uniref:Uncharacterized protein n=1 Tax=Vaccinium darrowii TaxID=229202 RepID=A0ACB7Z364_9ERIC|nr:hypothetical protein Vadar_002743 [Vaccinium darrowii]
MGDGLTFALSLADRRFAVHKADFSEWVRRIRKRAFLWARKRLEKTPAIAIKAGVRGGLELIWASSYACNVWYPLKYRSPNIKVWLMG